MINTFENRTKVVDKAGNEGKIQVTRHIRKLLEAGKESRVNVEFDNGFVRTYYVDDLTEFVEEPEPAYMTKEEFIDEVNSSHTVEELKEVINKMVVQLF